MATTTRACIYQVSGEALAAKLGMPPNVRVTGVRRDLNRHDVFVIVLDGIGPVVAPGAILIEVRGDIKLNVANACEWDIS